MGSLRERRRLQIIKSAIKVFGDEGFHNGTMEEIAQGAGLGKGTVYEYFNSKQELFGSVILYLLDSFVKNVEGIKDESLSSKEKMISLMDRSQEFMTTHSSIIKETIFHTEYSCEGFKEETEKLHRQIFTSLMGIIRDGMESNEIDESIDKGTLTFILLNTILGIVNIKNQYGDRFSLENESIIEILYNGIG